jgi:hypothetical protein
MLRETPGVLRARTAVRALSIVAPRLLEASAGAGLQLGQYVASAYFVCGSDTSTSVAPQALILAQGRAHRRLHLRVHARR